MVIMGVCITVVEVPTSLFYINSITMLYTKNTNCHNTCIAGLTC